MIIDRHFWQDEHIAECLAQERKQWPGHFDKEGRRLCDLWRGPVRLASMNHSFSASTTHGACISVRRKLLKMCNGWTRTSRAAPP
jgi:hypothetical protein